MKTFICHYPKLKDRINYLLPALKEVGFDDVITVNGLSRDQITDEHRKFFANDLNLSNERKQKYKMDKPTNPGYDIFSDWLKPILANFLTHIEIWKQIIESKEKYCLVLEDDARILDNFKYRWNQVLSQIPEDLDIAYLHEGCGFTVEKDIGINTHPDQIFYKCPQQWSRTCCSYIISKNFAIKLLEDLYPILMSIDHELNYLQRKLNANVYWTSPALFFEGSSTNYTSTIQKQP